MAFQLEGEVDRAARREYGFVELAIDDASDLLAGVASNGAGVTTVWMSHADHLKKIPPGFEPIAHTSNSPICAIRNKAKRIYGVQFHPEVAHTARGNQVLRNYLYEICGCTGGWNVSSFIQQAVEDVRQKVGMAVFFVR